MWCRDLSCLLVFLDVEYREYTKVLNGVLGSVHIYWGVVSIPFAPFRFLSDMSGKRFHHEVGNIPHSVLSTFNGLLLSIKLSG